MKLVLLHLGVGHEDILILLDGDTLIVFVQFAIFLVVLVFAVLFAEVRTIMGPLAAGVLVVVTMLAVLVLLVLAVLLASLLGPLILFLIPVVRLLLVTIRLLSNQLKIFRVLILEVLVILQVHGVLVVKIFRIFGILQVVVIVLGVVVVLGGTRSHAFFKFAEGLS